MAAELMNMGGDGLAGLGRVNAITPQYYVLGVKPNPVRSAEGSA